VLGASADRCRSKVRNTIRREVDGVVAATVTGTGGFVDLARRRLAVPPADLVALLASLPFADHLEELPSLSPRVDGAR
jgi:acyl-CoA thioester hydrolase